MCYEPPFLRFRTMISFFEWAVQMGWSCIELGKLSKSSMMIVLYHIEALYFPSLVPKSICH